ncbi:diguanylate cyclase [Geomonas sp. Red32]|uniref:sensor domain-containing diguanylate cyclase n=1 Tax=Geomonas sp. Red32 TaxID=2912856 RepID=UPI00202CBFE9|nr:diguanylate cyclase [Geomonas sp. Red32]MCM0083885.1 diguanylate cyclase [Geomonas sp. Red32]
MADNLESQVKGLQDLVEVSRAVVSTLDLDTVLQAILTSAMTLAETPAGSIALYHSPARKLTLRAHAGLSADFVKKESWEVVPGGVTERALATAEAVVVEDTEGTPSFADPVLLGEGIRSLLCFPLIFQGGGLGVLYLDDFVPRRFEQQKLNLLAILASFAAMAINNASLHKRTKLLAITDPLTGLHNDRYFKHFFRQEMARARRYHKPFSIIILDVDDFKAYNDSFGHATGDELLSHLGGVILQTVRGVDVAFRFGGEEFIVLLPETRLANAILAAERLREGIERVTAKNLVGTATRGVTVSVGVASYPDNGDSMDELFNIADCLVYRAKCCGKNKVYHQESLLNPTP